jgi:hypothetical protein
VLIHPNPFSDRSGMIGRCRGRGVPRVLSAPSSCGVANSGVKAQLLYQRCARHLFTAVPSPKLRLPHDSDVFACRIRLLQELERNPALIGLDLCQSGIGGTGVASIAVALGSNSLYLAQPNTNLTYLNIQVIRAMILQS